MIEVAAVFITLGATLYHTIHQSMYAIVCIAFLCSVAVFVFSAKKVVLLPLSIMVFIVIGGITMWWQDVPVPYSVYGNRIITGKVISVNRQLEKTQIVISDESYPYRLQVSYDGAQRILPGDVLRVKGEVVAPEDFNTDTGRVFGYQYFMLSKGIVGVVQRGNVSVLHVGPLSLARFATIARYSFADTYATYISFPVDGVVAGMVVGYQGGLPADVQDLFRYTGVLHVLVLSGYNITLFAGFLATLLKRVPFRIRTILTLIVVLMIVLISGSGVAAVRAGVMGSLCSLGSMSHNRYHALRALFVCYLLFFFQSPLIIFSDPGFQLSFLATVFMIAVLPHLQQWFSFIPRTEYVDVRELIVLACTSPVFMLPYTMYFSGIFPLASVPANMLLAVVTPLIAIIGVVLLCVSWCGPLAVILGTVLSFVGTTILRILIACSSLPMWNTPPLAWWGVVTIYSAILFIVFRTKIMRFWWQYQNSFQQQPSKAVQ